MCPSTPILTKNYCHKHIQEWVLNVAHVIQKREAIFEA
jgi:hypothetical protein